MIVRSFLFVATITFLPLSVTSYRRDRYLLQPSQRLAPSKSRTTLVSTALSLARQRINVLNNFDFNLFHHRMTLRGGALSNVNKLADHDSDDEDHEEEEEDNESTPPEDILQQQQQIIKDSILKYQMEQNHLYQLRSTLLSEALSARGISIGPTISDVSTADGERPPQVVDWDCCLSTIEEPKTCLYSFDAEPNTKVVSPIGTTQFISLRALNRLRRTDPTKVEPMWHSKYAILQSWFGEESEYSLLQYVGFRGFIISNVLLDSRGIVLRSILFLLLLCTTLLVLPMVEYMVGSILVSKPFWDKWNQWARFAHAALPLKLLMGQMIWKFFAGLFANLEGRIREILIDWESSILEEAIPITNGVGSIFQQDMDRANHENDTSDDEDDSFPQ